MKLEQREIGRIVGIEPGPTLVAVAGIHGNEPAGLEAAQRVFRRLASAGMQLRGEFVVYAGNLASLRKGVRYQAKDLNRVWTEPRVTELLSRGPEALFDEEDREQLELLRLLGDAKSRARGTVHLADLHTTSAAGIPFILFGDTVAQRDFASAFPIPIILGLEEQVDGVLSSYWTQRGCITFAVEGGQHDDPVTTDSLEAVLWLALAQAGLFSEAQIPEVARAAALLDEQRRGLPRVLEVVSRRSITPQDSFQMEPGFRNIDHAREGQLLARDRTGEIRAPADGLVIMPLYQGLGGEGYFWGREVSPARLKVADALRRLGVERLLSLLPGVARDPQHPARFILGAKVARLYPLQVFHLLGYRRMRQHGDELSLERQAG